MNPLSALFSAALAMVIAISIAACNRDGTPISNPPVDGGTPAGATAGPGTSVAVTSGATAVVTPTLESAARATALVEAVLPTYERSIGMPGTRPGELQLPFDVAVAPDGNLWVSDSKGAQKLTPTGELVVQIDPPTLPMARGLAVAPDGTLYVTGYGAQVLKFAADGTPAGTIGEAGEGPGQLKQPVDVGLDAEGNLYVADSGNRTVESFTPDGTHRLTFGGPGQGRGQFTRPWSVAVDSQGRVYVGLGDDYLVQRFDPQGQYIDAFGRSGASDNVWQIAGLTIEGDTLYGLDVPKQLVTAYDLTVDPPVQKWQFGSLGIGRDQFSSPSGLDVRGGLIYVADTTNNRIVVFQVKPTG